MFQKVFNRVNKEEKKKDTIQNDSIKKEVVVKLTKEQRKEKKQSFRDYYAKRSPVSVAGKLHNQPFIMSQPYALDQLIKNRKPLLVMFEQKKCRDCDEIHNDIFKRKETLQQVKKFNVVRMDMWGKDKIVSHSGKTMTMKEFAKQLDARGVLANHLTIACSVGQKGVFKLSGQ